MSWILETYLSSQTPGALASFTSTWHQTEWFRKREPQLKTNAPTRLSHGAFGVRKQAGQTMGANWQASLLRGLCIGSPSSCLSCLHSHPDFLWRWAGMSKCKQKQSCPSRVGFGHGVLLWTELCFPHEPHVTVTPFPKPGCVFSSLPLSPS